MSVPLSAMLAEDLRQFTVPLGLNAFLDQILYEDMAILQGYLTEDDEQRDPTLPPFGPQLDFYFRGRLSDSLGLSLPSIAGIELVLGAGRIGFDAAVDFEAQHFSATLMADVLRLRFARSLLQPVVQQEIVDPNDPAGQRKLTVYVADPDESKRIELVFPVAVSIDEEGSIDVSWPENSPESITLPPAMIGDTKVVVEGNLGIDFSTTSALPNVTGRALDPAWVGLVVRNFKIYLPPDVAGILPEQLSGSCLIGSNGFSAVIRGQWLDAAGRPRAILKQVQQSDGSIKEFYEGPGSFSFFGVPGALRSLELDFEDNVPVRCEIDSEFLLPFFEAPVAANLGIGLDGSIDLELRGVDGDAQPLVKVRKEDLLELTIASLAVRRRADSVEFAISGTIQPLIPGMECPTFRVDELSIDSKGNIRLEGGWLNLREKYTVDFHGFQLEISKLGFGNTEDGGKWIGFSGGVRLVAGMPAGASVEGLRITWYEDGRRPPIQITLNGVRVDFEVPNTLKFSGAVSYISDKQQFHGAIKLDLIALKMQVDAIAVFGIEQGQNYLGIYLAAQFPAGIPLFATGLGVYGMAGLFALNMEPKRLPTQPWYEIGSTSDWYHSSPVGVTSLKDKWTAHLGSMAFGAGVTLGTLADNGHAFSAQMLLAIVFPGPILLLQGSANLLKERATLDTDATFRAIAVLDGRAGTLQVGLDAQYRFDNSGALIDIRGAAEGFFNFNDPNAWRLNVGLKDPRERRLTARLFQLFEANAYVMLNAQQLAMGAWIGFKQHWQFGPLSVALEAWIDGNARVSWKPAHFYGDLWLHGSAKLAVFGFGVGLTVDARIAADVFDPFHVVGQFRVAIDLPWPFSDISVNIRLEWGPDPSPPPLPLPLKEVAIEHFKATTSWPLPRDLLLFPDYDENRDGFAEFPPQGAIPAGELEGAPIVPLDCRPHITFARNINDDALVGVNPQRVIPEWERIGDPVRNQGPARIRYGLKEVVLEKFTTERWEPVARKAKDANDPKVSTLYGSWAPVPQMPGGGGRNAGQVKLWLWSKTLFEYTRSSSRAWDEWFANNFTGYPCGSIPDVCLDFEEVELANGLPGPWQHPQEPDLIVRPDRERISIIELAQPEQGFTHALCLEVPDDIDIDLPQPTDIVRIKGLGLTSAEPFAAFDSNNVAYSATLESGPDGPYIEIRGKDLVSILIVYGIRNLPSKPHVQQVLAQPVSAAIGCDYVAMRDQLVFVEFHGKLSAVDLATNQYKVLGTGYTEPEDVVVTDDGTTAYITERSGALLRVDLTASRVDRSSAVVITSGMKAPQQIALDEAGGKAYVVEFDPSGRLLRIDLDGQTRGQQTVLATGLNNAVGLLFTTDWKVAYVGEQGANRILRINLATGARQTVVDNLPGLFFLHWASEDQKILVPQRDPHNLVYRIDLSADRIHAKEWIINVPFRPSSVAVLPDGRLAVCSETVVTAYRFNLGLLSICDVRGPLLIRHFEEELARWSQQAEVLEPHTRYRLKIVTSINARGEGKLRWYSADKDVTEFAYFRTAGPPGVAKLTAPIGSEALETFATPLDDLTRYVQRTMPRAVEPTPDTPVPPRLFYRAYDVGIEFNENYVDLMYRLGRRDLTIHLYDGNGAIRNEKGGRLVLANQWSEAEELTLTEREERWISVLGASGCTLVDLGSVVKNTTFNAASEPHVLPPLALCEARLVPALLHDAFAGYGIGPVATGPDGRFEQWQVQDDPGSPPSHWEIAEDPDHDFVLVQTKDAATTLIYAHLPESPQENPDQPSTWTDYRLQVHLRSTDGRIGVVWRYQNVGRHYRFVMDRQARRREVIRMEAGNPVVLAFDSFTYTPEQTYVVTVEAVNSSFRVYQDGAFVFAVMDPVISEGRVGVHCAGNLNARFTDIFVDDFRTSAPVVYQFSFLTSRFKNFVDHLGSFENETWRVELSSSVNVAPLIGAAVLPSAVPSEAESRAYDALFTQLPPAPASPVVRVTRVEQSGSAIAFLIQSPEPLDWTRIRLELLRAEVQTTQYIPVEERVLRKLDGSGLMIVVPASNAAGSLLSPGEYRLNFTYRRDNRAFDSQSELLSEAGHTTPEQATLDIPWQTRV